MKTCSICGADLPDGGWEFIEHNGVVICSRTVHTDLTDDNGEPLRPIRICAECREEKTQ